MAKPNMEPAGLRVSVYLETDTRRPTAGLLGFAMLNPTYALNFISLSSFIHNR